MTTKQKRALKKKLRIIKEKTLAYFFICLMLFGSFIPHASYALTGGPSQPEVQSFTPIGTSDMVNPFTGDFSYNIPLLDVGGYPINLAYASGITMDQEASWVGLGWNINVGTVNRGLRGLPDDFDGDEVVHDLKMKPNRTFGGSFTVGEIELFGNKVAKNKTPIFDSINLSVKLGINYNNYTGMGAQIGVNPSFFMGAGSKYVEQVDLGLSSNSNSGLSVQPNISFRAKTSKNDEGEKKVLGKLGLSGGFNTRAGLQELTVNANLMKPLIKTENMGPLGAYGNSSYLLPQPTYTPTVNHHNNSFNITGRFKTGGEIFGTAVGLSADLSYSQQKLKSYSRTSKAYGYFNSDQAHKESSEQKKPYKDAGVLMDFNRENDGSFTENTPNLPLTNFTYDMFSVSGQGVGGSYRGFRSDIGYVYDANSRSRSNSGSLGVEMGTGNAYQAGVDIAVTSVNSKSGRWTDENDADDVLPFRAEKPYKEYEGYYLKEANEKSVSSDPAHKARFGSSDPVRFGLQKNGFFNVSLTNDLEQTSNSATTEYNQNYRDKRAKRNSVISILKREEVVEGLGINRNPYPDTYAAPDHHMAEIVSLGSDGSRYVYGIAAYNTRKEEVSFAVGDELGSKDEKNYPFSGDCATGLIQYDPTNEITGHKGDDSDENTWGVDNYYSNTKTPAYAHSFLLTAIISPDYVDSDNTPGPSDGDMGNYTKFEYKKNSDIYKWKTPLGEGIANYNEGSKANLHDDKASYLYGEKELWYLDKIETKNFIAVFEVEDRKDACGVEGKHGALKDNSNMKALKKISLYAKPDYIQNGSNAEPIKEVHFEYEYSLCPNVPNNNGQFYDGNEDGQNDNVLKGKLTLKKVYFTYRGSKRGKFSPYQFNYNENFSYPNSNEDLNYPYNIKGYDRWGCYKKNEAQGCGKDDLLSTAEYPYVEQTNKQTIDQYASAWCMSSVDLPSGGKIKVHYESDDYGFVQHKQAMQMAKIIGVEDDNGTINTGAGNFPVLSLSDDDNKNRKIYFELQDQTTPIDEYFKGVDNLYFKVLSQIRTTDNTNFSDKYDYVVGYAQIRSKSTTTYQGNQVGVLELEPVDFRDNGNNADYNPISFAGIQFTRLNLPRMAYDTNVGLKDDQGFGAQVLGAFVDALTGFFTEFRNPNKSLWDKERGTKIVLNKSWIRVNNISGTKLGGGCRVAKIEISDEWGEMTDGTMGSYDYGQEYEYDLEDGSSSGVASYEPQIGGDENPFKQPVTYESKNRLRPDDRFYQEAPFGESFFPSASVGYSRVIVKNIERQHVTRHATGHVEHEFYTAKDFPTIVKKTEVDHIRSKSNPFSVTSLLKTHHRDFMTATQGFVIETNDMHGKPRKQKVYQENKDEPITSVEYKYSSEPYLTNSARLTNKAKVIYQNGNTSEEEIGVHFDAVADFRQMRTTTIGGTAKLGLDNFFVGPAPVIVPSAWPTVSYERTQFRSAGITKLVQRFGILEETIATDLGSSVRTKNLAYDAETGEVLLTETATNFEDAIYTLNYPAYWHYDQMGPAYKNIDFVSDPMTFDANGVGAHTNASKYFSEGDEVLIASSNIEKGWVTNVSGNEITVLLKNGTPLTNPAILKVLRSGRRNMQMQPMASITTLQNPLTSFQSNLYENVIQASAIEFSDEWRTYCDCHEDSNGNLSTTNPYVLGTKGNFRPVTSHLHLSGRTQSDYDSNTNIRKDGVFTSYTPFYKLTIGGDWEIDKKDWTYTAEVTEFNPFGQELENRDALGRYSAATFGFNQTLATAAAANARYKDIGFDSFEDYDFSPCADNHFKFDKDQITLSKDESHTGNTSIKITAGSSTVLSKNLADSWCDEAECSLDVNVASTDHIQLGSSFTIGAINGSGVYNMTYQVLVGSPQMLINPLNNSLIIKKSGTWTVEVTFTDDEGCTRTKTLTKVGSNLTETYNN